MVNHPMNPTQVTDVGSHQTMEGLRPQRSPTKDGSFLRVILVFVLMLALVAGLSFLGKGERTKEFTGELTQEGQTQSCSLVLTHTLQDKVLGFNGLSGSLRIYDDSGKLVKKIPLADFTHTRTGGYLTCSPSALQDTEIFLDKKLKNIVVTAEEFTFIAASPEFLDQIGFSSDS